MRRRALISLVLGARGLAIPIVGTAPGAPDRRDRRVAKRGVRRATAAWIKAVVPPRVGLPSWRDRSRRRSAQQSGARLCSSPRSLFRNPV
jgi:hypothetical protein